jgi:capsular polysaccharide export protein
VHEYGDRRSFLFLQGPHGPFFDRLARQLRAAGAKVARVGFNSGDAAFWTDRESYVAFDGRPPDWPAALSRLIAERGVTDIVLYGDTRPVHRAARAAAAAAGLTLHVFEEGYLRPWWVTYERDGANGNSPLMEMSVARMAAAQAARGAMLAPQPGPAAPASWGDLRQHVFYGALYHFHVLMRNGAYPHFSPHRALSVGAEFRLSLGRLLSMPWHAAARWARTRGVLASDAPFHLVLLQLEHDASIRAHSPFASMTEFLDRVIAGFAAGAPGHHLLVVKGHPLDDGRAALARATRRIARRHGVAGRVRFVPGGKLAHLLDHARSAVTVNSTAAQQALWRGLPVRAFGRAVYAKPELVSDQPIADFFVAPRPPDPAAYAAFRAFLLGTSQLPGGFYSARGRRLLLRRAADCLLAPQGPYDASGAGAAHTARLRLVR